MPLSVLVKLQRAPERWLSRCRSISEVGSYGSRPFCWLVWIEPILDRARFMDRGHFAILWIEAILPAAMDRGHFAILWIEVILPFMSASILQRSPPAAGDVVNAPVTLPVGEG